MEKTYPNYGVIELTNDGDAMQITEMSELEYNQRKLRLTK
jgi:hypothetical protein